jgi:hypothetical protein
LPHVRLTVLAAVTAAAVTACAAAGHPGGSEGPAPRLHFPGLQTLPAAKHTPAIPAHGAYFGAWVRQGAYTQAARVLALDMLQGALGRRLDIVHTYLTWQGTFPKLSDQVMLGQGSLLLLSWTGTVSTVVTSGAADGVIRQVAREIKSVRKPMFLEWRWEMDRPNLRSVVGTPAQFIAAWKHVRAVFAQQHVRNVAWVWCPTAKGFAAGGDAPAYYPGDAEVDWVCADAYPGPGPYRSFYDVTRPFLSWASHHRKPVMIGEYGVPASYGPLRRAQWLRGAAQTVRADPQIKALVYFDSNPAGATPAHGLALDYGTPPMQAFREIANSPYFNPRRLTLTR